MDAELKRKWIRALRSGEYVQGQEVLRDGAGRFCCLGVLADIQGCDWKTFPEHKLKGLLGTLDFDVGLYWSTQAILTNMNDSGSSFSEIADYIEKHL